MAALTTRARGLYESTLLDGVAATNNGSWTDVRELHPSSVHISGITTATVQIRGSNADAAPADTAHEIQLGGDITANTIVEFTAPINWIKARISAWTAGTITARYTGRKLR